ncbi:hypothetical protein B1H20_10235 [Streptomyces violaceoruber]|uniref:Uncharacterized protein n=1 Tax=Streptomyces violaceoruber TaxID=1935 RepID=A0A1V0U923_STRVN|nr:hypothetical protein B1H20_10235 [Streptomyces violaceoruber]
MPFPPCGFLRNRRRPLPSNRQAADSGCGRTGDRTPTLRTCTHHSPSTRGRRGPCARSSGWNPGMWRTACARPSARPMSAPRT